MRMADKPDPSDKEARIVEARMKLRDRFFARMKSTPGMADDKPMGEGPANRHGGPRRVITPQLYAWKGAKWVARLELMKQDVLGYWERRGYSNTGHPWREDRYS